MDSTSIIDYIKKNYPKVVFTPFKFKQSNAIAFILSDDNLVIGFINSNGTLCKLIEPIDIKNLTSSDIKTAIEKIPTVKGFTEKDKTRLLRMFEQKEETISKKDHDKIIYDLETKLEERNNNLETEYKALFDSKSNEIVLIKKEFEDKIQSITEQYDDSLKQLNECRQQIVDQNQSILDGINKYKESIKEYISSKDLKIEDLEKIHKQDIKEREILQEKLNNLLENEKKSMQQLLENKDLISDYDRQLDEKDKIVNELKDSMENIKNELDIANEELNKSKLETELLKGYRNRCRDKILKERDQIINTINEYNDTWLSWIEKADVNIKDQKKLLIEEFNQIKQNLEKTLQDKIEESNLSNKEVKRLSQNIKDIEMTLQKTINDQLIELSKKEEELKANQNTISELTLSISEKDNVISEKDNVITEKDNAISEKDNVISDIENQILEKDKKISDIENQILEKDKKISDIESELSENKQNLSNIEKEIIERDKLLSEKDELLYEKDQLMISKERACKNEIEESNKRIEKLQSDFDEIKLLLEQNRNTPIEVSIDYDNCYDVIKNFVSLNNIFYRKQEIIKKLDNIIENNLGSFNNLTPEMKQTIKTDYDTVKTEITKHIQFLNLSEYINSPNFEYLKSKTSRSRVPESFCNDLTNLLEYWNMNKLLYREQDTRLTNIYEDLSGAVRVYIRVKPLLSNQMSNTVEIKSVENKKTRGFIVDCSEDKNTKYKQKIYFGEFYGIFEEDFTNLDVYTGQRGSVPLDNSLVVDTNNIIESSETISPGLYNTFKQVEQGYSIVIFGYGISGSGKSFTLLGSRGNPGILHYGLSNLKNVTNIRLKYLFEQSYNKINFNNRQLSGIIYNLINQISQFKAFSVDETKIFERAIPSYINVKNLKVEDIYALSDIIEKYRIENKRIKMTPNNPSSSRSHLYLVFEITFENGKRGFITIVDTAGRESPIDIYNTFIDTDKTSLPSVMAPPPVGGVINIEKNLLDQYRGVYDPKDVFEILNESFYVNETLNHLIYYFNLKNGKTIDTPKQKLDKRFNVIYRIKNFFVQPQQEESVIDSTNNVLMIPILKFLDNLTIKAIEENSEENKQEWKPTKFITICTVRQELDYCDQTVETMDFAQSIKSS